MCGYPVLAAASLSLLLMPLPRSAFLEPAPVASALLEAPAIFHAPALASALLEAPAIFHAPALASALLEPSAFASAFLEPSALASALLESAPLTAAFATVLAVRPLALTATASASGAGLCRVLHDLCGGAGRIDRLRLHRHRDDEGRRRDRASSQCFFEHEYHSVGSVTVAGNTRTHEAQIDPSNRGSRP
ncbi:hypothetical protein [Microbispora bryophytorum]|uniref:hypothetical protein n=1 Tax=Microbispora bryophytorum TaxID=1460882 RepID=UPI00115C26E5|nr:hypothetical protein [Microbispora bryophytorum]MBD3135120.1 hypothetical protein [Microbispora bryophytorum]TQS08655.1 hypothetical protein FLX07_05205 [Microbispora bryophytorum]